MPQIERTPKHLRPYEFHGVDFHETDVEQAKADCVLCGREGKFVVKVETGQYRCLVCNEGNDKGGGNAIVFLRKLWEASDKATQSYSELEKSRKLLFPETLAEWGVCKSESTGDWLVPGYTTEGKLAQLYRYVRDVQTKRMLLLCTSELPHQLHGTHLFSSKKAITYICEGWGDGTILWELMKRAKQGKDKLELTSNEGASLYADANVIAVPGCNVFNPTWVNMFAGQTVVLMYDSDHPRKIKDTTRLAPPAGHEGAKRVAKMLAQADEPPNEIRYLAWGKEGYDPNLADGYDVKDWLSQGNTAVERIGYLDKLLNKVAPVPDDWIAGKKKGTDKGRVEFEMLSCTKWRDLINVWKQALKWTDGLDVGLSCMLATILSTEQAGDQLWMKIMSPPGSGKSVLCEAISVNKRYIHPKSTMRGFHSGYDDGTGDNHSPLQAMKNKTLVIKDGDTLLQSPNLGQILSEGRDIYDRVSRSGYRNKQSKDWEGVNLTFLLCGTQSLRALDASELGARFVDCVMMEEIDSDLEDEIAIRKAYQADRELLVKTNCKMESSDSPEMLKAKQLTGGYITHLRTNAQELLSGVSETHEVMVECHQLAKFVSYIRARPSKFQVEKVERELCTRLTSQLVRLSRCLAVVLNRDRDEEVMRRVRKCAMDTARGRTLEICRNLFSAGSEGMEPTELATLTHKGVEEERKFLRFLRDLGAVESFKIQGKSNTRWRLTRKMTSLYSLVGPK